MTSSPTNDSKGSQTSPSKGSEKSGLIYDIDNRGEQCFVRIYDEKPENNTFGRTRLLREVMEDREKIIDFLNEVEKQDWELDSDDIKHILNFEFDYIRKQHETTEFLTP